MLRIVITSYSIHYTKLYEGNPLRKATKNDNDLIKKIIIMSTVKRFRIDAFSKFRKLVEVKISR